MRPARRRRRRGVRVAMLITPGLSKRQAMVRRGAPPGVARGAPLALAEGAPLALDRYGAPVELHPLAQRFAVVADAYERGRPEYAPAIVGAIAAELCVPVGARVLDLAAGTGKLTRALLGAGLEVVAVEPQEELRELLAVRVADAEVVEGVAEAIPLPDATVAAVTVADAFHWFDHAAALAEIGRVLRPGGGLAILTTMPDWGGASWAHEVGTLIAGLRPEHPQFDGPPWREAVRAAGCWCEPWEVRMTVSQPALGARFVDYLASISWIAALEEDERLRLLDRAGAIVAAGETPRELQVHVTIGLTSLSAAVEAERG
jgi:SAM-dependent methyltransferase